MRILGESQLGRTSPEAFPFNKSTVHGLRELDSFGRLVVAANCLVIASDRLVGVSSVVVASDRLVGVPSVVMASDRLVGVSSVVVASG